MKLLQGITAYAYSTPLLVGATGYGCKCTPNSDCWPSQSEWSSLNSTINGALIRGVPPASVCYPEQPNYNEDACAFVRSQWFNSTWHATDPVSIDYPIWTNNSCNPIWPNGTSVTGDVNAGKNGCSIGNYPAYVVDATTPEQVATSFKWASKHNVRVIVKSTGHSYPGRSIGYGSLSIWTHHFRGIEYIESFKPKHCPVGAPLTAVRVGAGETGIDVQTALATRKSIIVTGGNPDVGLIGWLTGGGHGYLSSTYGMGADNLLEATIVTPLGDTLVANPCQNSDIFFAIRGGGGGTYGVVTEAVIKTYPSPKTTQHFFGFAALSLNITTEYWDMIGFLHAEMPRLKEGGMQGYYFLVAPPTVPTYSFIWVFYLYDKPNGTVEALMEPIEARLKSRPDLFQYYQNTTHGDTFMDIYGGSQNEVVATSGSAYGSWLLSPESLSDANKTARVFESIGPSIDPSTPNGPSNPTILGHMIASPKQPSYSPTTISMNPAWRRTLAHLIVVEAWPDGSPRSYIDSIYADITNNKIPALRKMSPDTGAYFNEADSYQPEWQKVFFGANYERLRGIKERVDPRGVLWCRRCVGSEAWVEESDGRLCRGGYGEGKGMQMAN